jgi:hypothetical protein
LVRLPVGEKLLTESHVALITFSFSCDRCAESDPRLYYSDASGIQIELARAFRGWRSAGLPCLQRGEGVRSVSRRGSQRKLDHIHDKMSVIELEITSGSTYPNDRQKEILSELESGKI